MNKQTTLFVFAWLSVLPHFFDIHLLFVVGSLLLLTWAYIAKFVLALQPHRFLIPVMALLAPAICFYHYRTLLGAEAATSLILLLLGIKFFELRTQRDSVVFLFVILLVGLYRVLFSQDLISFCYVLILFAGFIQYLLKLRNPQAKAFSEVSSLLRSKELYFTALFVLALFFLFPRFTTPFGRFVQDDRQIIGFSGELRPGEFANLTASEEVAFRVNFPDGKNRPWKELYFRGQVLSFTDGMNWKSMQTNSQRREVTFPERADYFISQTSRFGKVVFTLDGTSDLQINSDKSKLISYADGTYSLIHDLRQSFVSQGQLGALEAPTARQQQRLLRLPDNFLAENPQSDEFIRRLKKLPSLNQQIEAMRSYISKGFVYTTTTPDYENLDAFLFGTRDGFCEHYASAVAHLLRGLGVPARIIIGFQGGEFNEFGGFLAVRDKYAHAWLEYYHDNSWQRLDPTAWVNTRRVTAPAFVQSSVDQMSFFNQAYYYLDGLNNRFNLFFLTFTRDEQLGLLESYGFKNVGVWHLVGLLFLALLGLILLYILIINIRLGFKTESEKLRLQINKILSAKQILWAKHQGPIELLASLDSDEKELYSKIQPLVQRFVRLKYQKNN